MKVVLFFTCFMLSLYMSAQADKVIFDNNKDENILYGECTRDGFIMPELAEWFDEEYNSYKVNDEIFIPGYDIKFDSIYVFMGTWCEDSHREVPRFCKIMDNPYFEGIKIRFFCLNGDKTTDIIDTEEYYIQYIPTFIFYYKGEELCRIVEQPKDSLEEDIMDLLYRIQP